MASADVQGNMLGVTDKRRTQGNGAANIVPTNYSSVTTLRARLQTINGTYFTTAMLNSMTKNDMVYAVRLNDEAAGL